jgi:Planctomycete cytochrome C
MYHLCKNRYIRISISKTMNHKLFYTLIIACTLVFACKHEPEMLVLNDTGNGGGNNGGPVDTLVVNPDPCDPDSVYFVTQVLPILVSNCAMEDCHDAITAEDGIQLDSYAAVMGSDIITPGDAGDSDFIAVLTETGNDLMPPTDMGGPLSAEQIALLTQWVNQGALNNSCTPDCDPTQFSYTTNLLPVIELACQGCHSGANPSGGVAMDTFGEIQTMALDGSLMHSLLGTGGYSIMPDNTLGLPECNITQFQLWVNAGAPNN